MLCSMHAPDVGNIFAGLQMLFGLNAMLGFLGHGISIHFGNT